VLGYLADTHLPSYNPAKAKQLVAQYEQSTGQKIKFTYLAGQDADPLKSAQFIATTWRRPV
jgi:hypothetical protein